MNRVAPARTLAPWVAPGRAFALLLAAAALVLPAGTASAATGPPTLDLKGPKGLGLLDRVKATGVVPGFAGEQVTIKVSASGREVEGGKVTPAGDGRFSFRFAIDACCAYEVTATAAGRTSHARRFRVRVPRRLGKGPVTRLYNDALRAQGYYVGHAGSRFGIGSRLGTLAFRKVNGMGRRTGYLPAIFRKLLRGEGAFQPRFSDGHHVEADLSRQVMALVEADRPVATFHISSGTGATPTVRGNFRFYMKQPGYNSKRMYYSVYFIGGYATHGYNPVPTYPASHGCLRNPIPFARYIYNWIDIGDPMHVYG
ncbi:MAG TPA: L,D-transpeptidase family protein [Solirubrobacterales bacterium]|nr:L,D-transpeptidase family protein [Solirubrobacterales bacterium]